MFAYAEGSTLLSTRRAFVAIDLPRYVRIVNMAA